MLKLLRRIFCKCEPVAETRQEFGLPIVAAGQEWRLSPRGNGDPWGDKAYRPVKVLDVREGWVRYDMGPGPFRDERKTIGSFLSMYRLVSPNAGVTGA